MCDTNNPKRTLTDVYRFGLSALSLVPEAMLPTAASPEPTGNQNSGVVLPPANEFAPVASVADFNGHGDATPNVGGGAVHIIGGVRPATKPETESARDRASDLLNQGMDLSDAGHPEEALRCLTEALAVLALLAECGDADAPLKTGVALFTMGRTLRRAGRLEEAADKLRKALFIHEALQTEPVRAKAQEETAWVLAEQSILLREQGQLERAHACAARAVSTVEAITAPVDTVEVNRLLVWTLRCQGKTLERLHRSLEASECYRRAAVLSKAVKQGRQAEAGEDSLPE